MPVTLFGRPVDVTKSVGTRRVGGQPLPDPKAIAISTSLQTVTEQESMNLQPDPTLGAPFSSFPNNRLTVAQMGPGEPAENFPLGAEPRQWKYRVGWNFPTTPDTDRGIDGTLLRGIADTSWLVRRCIEVRKAELMSLNWEIVGAGRTGKEKKAHAAQNEALIRYLTEWFRYPEGYYSFVTPDTQYDPATVRQMDRGTWQRRGLVDWADWFDACLEDYFVGDWWTVWPQRTLGNEMLGLRRVDGEHIKALIDLDGRIPPPPMPAWQQYLYGVPRASWAADELYYWPRVVRNMTPYGYGHVQQALVAINLALKYDEWNTAAYTESRVPMGLLEAAPGETPDQLSDVADFLNGAVATLAARQMVYPVPAGTKWQAIKPFVFDTSFAYYVIELLCACFDVQPEQLGFAPNKGGGLGGKGWSEGQEAAYRRKGPVPTARWIERKLTRVIQEQWRAQGGQFVEFRFTDIQDVDKQQTYQANQVAIQSAQLSLDTLAEEQGEQGPGYGRILVAGGNVLFLDEGFGIFNGQSVRLEKPPDPALQPVSQLPDVPPDPGGGGPPKAGAPVTKMVWHEADHPRDDIGRFTDGGGRSTLVPLDRDHPPAHIATLKLPPAWTDVHVNPDPQGTLQAVGRDAKGRAQYVYHADFAATQAAQKFSRVDRLRQEFDTVHRENAARQAAEEARMRAHADCLAVIMALGIRPGSDADTKAAVKAYGATTLEGRHVVTTDGTTRLQYVGKKGVALDLPVHDPDVADLLRQRASAAGPTGRLFPDVSGDSLRRYTQTLDHGTFKPKDFRTLKGTTVALDAMATVPTPTAPAQYVRAVKQVATQVARVLGNTPPVALQSYIDPTIFGEWRAHAHV